MGRFVQNASRSQFLSIRFAPKKESEILLARECNGVDLLGKMDFLWKRVL